MHLNVMNEWQLSLSELEAAERADKADKEEYDRAWNEASDAEKLAEMRLQDSRDLDSLYQHRINY